MSKSLLAYAVQVVPTADARILRETAKRIVKEKPTDSGHSLSACELLRYQGAYWLVPCEFVQWLVGDIQHRPEPSAVQMVARSVATVLKNWGLCEVKTPCGGELTINQLNLTVLKKHDPRTSTIVFYDYSCVINLISTREEYTV